MLFTQLCWLAQEYSHWSGGRDDKINNQWKYSLYDDVLSAVICFSRKRRNKMAASDQIKKELHLNNTSNILLIGCEGDTDQEMYQKLINQ